LRIVDDQGNVVGPEPDRRNSDQRASGNEGYYNKPEETANVLVETAGCCTGDIGLMHEDGFFQIVDRKKDMVLVSGFNVFPNEIEEVIAAHP